MSLYIGHLSSRTRRNELEHVFQRFGRCNIRLKDGYGFVVYDYPPNAEKALRVLHGRNICGEPLTLAWSNKQPRPFKKISRADRSYDHEPLRVRSSSRGGDYGNRKLDLNVQRDYKMSIDQPESHDVRLNSADLRNAEIDYHQDHVNEYTREENHDCGEDLLNESGRVVTNLVDSDRWDGQSHDLSKGNDVEHEMEFDRYIGYDRKDDDENHQIVYSGSAAQCPQEKIARELIGEGTLNHPKDSKVHQACYSCGALGHRKRNCPYEKTSRRYFSGFDHRHDGDIGRGGRGQGGMETFGSNSREKQQQDKDPLRTKRSEDTRKASGSGKHGRLIKSGSSPIAKESDRAWEKDYGGKKRSRRRDRTPKRHSAKKARLISSSLHPDYNASRSHSKSKSIKHMPRPISWSRSRSISSRAHSLSTNLRTSLISHYPRSISSKSSSMLSSPTSLSLSVSLSRPLPSPLNKVQFNLRGTLDMSNSPESTEIMVRGEPAEGDVELENANFENRVALVDMKNARSSASVETEVEKDQAIQRDDSDNHMTSRSVSQAKNPSTPDSEKGAFAAGYLSPERLREIRSSQDFDALTTKDVVLPLIKIDSELTSGCSTSISLEELCMVMKHYGLEPSDENQRHLSVEAYFGSACMWPWEIIYYRRLKKGPISTENYASRVAQNKEFGIVDKYVRSSSGWGELNRP
ncbi:serine/arginine-rich splicing factor 4-like [Durio zibethinus]|uniref:Serine/arginine-rich splicing factor 4-like n=1 Tax=Durio zibethinus TaxID=66656 RepID=A0A6P5YW74_DURZI|nr:serine/arginine-rich splicing factor 4-like [Durio zibethinus]XP_022744790.1 serine/arginine-rich splicing factor 4-like [Durio zibethinus]